MTRSNQPVSWPAAMLVIAIAGAAPAAAQSPSGGRFEISANVGAQTSASTFTASNTFASNGGETGTVDVDHGAKTALAFSVGAAVRLLPRFWVGAQYAMGEMKPGATLSANIPHPILFDVPRLVEGSVNDLTHKEQNVHVSVMYALPVAAVDVRIMGGPTFFNVKQDFVSGVTISETYPFDTAAFDDATTKQISETAVGFNVGADISRPLSPNVGVGALVRYSRADVKFDDPDVGRQSVTAGGFEVLGGVRLRF